MHTVPRYRFAEFVLSPRRRVLIRAGREQPLIPRYFDLLVFLVEHRREAVHRRDIFDHVWSDVVVSDSALTQAIRTIRRALGDDSREPRFVRTVSRHGYRFVFADVVEEDEDREWVVEASGQAAAARPAETDPFEPLLARLIDPTADEDEQIEAAERLHALGTAEALERLGTRPGHARGRALLRASRWDVPGAGAVPLAGEPGAMRSVAALVALRLRRAARLVAVRWAGAAIGGACAGALAGALGGLLLSIASGGDTPLAIAPVLSALGAVTGAAAGAGVGAGLATAEAAVRSRRLGALVLGAAAGGGVVGLSVEWLSRWSLATLVGVRVAVGGGLEGLVLGGAAGFGYALATRRASGLAAPRGARRLRAALITAGTCGAAAMVLTLAGRPLVGGTIHAIAQAAQGSQAALTPLGHLIGEPDFGPISRAVIAVGEAAMFGAGLVLGLARRA